MLGKILSTMLILVVVAIFFVFVLPFPSDVVKFIVLFILIAVLTVGLLVYKIYKKDHDRLDEKTESLFLSIREWMQENPAQTKIVTASILFITATGISQFFNDFSYFNSREQEMVSGHVSIIIAARLISLALFSILNVYFIPPFVKRMGNNNNGGFWTILIGFFGLVLCGPLPVIWFGLGLGTSLFVQFTGIHMVVQSQRN